MTDKEFTIWGLEQWEKLMENRTDEEPEQEQNIPNRFRIAWVHSDPKDPTKWPGLREQLRGIESFLYRDVIRWKYRERLMKLVAEMQLTLCEHLPISGVEAYGEENGTRWMIIPKEELKDEDRETIKEFLKVEEYTWLSEL